MREAGIFGQNGQCITSALYRVISIDRSGARFNRHSYFWAIAGAEVRAQVRAEVGALLGDAIK